MICSLPTVHSLPPSLFETDRLQISISAVTARYSSLGGTISRHHGRARPRVALSAGRAVVLRRSNTAASEAASTTTLELDPAASVVRKFYDGINRRDVASVEDLISLNCVYEDLIFSQPFTGRKAILDFFKQFSDSISGDLQFSIDDISEEDSAAVGVTWHLEWKGKPFPFSRGCSFYRLDVINGRRQIVFGRDAVEPAIKPGEAALVAIRGVTWLLQNFPFLGDRL